MKHTLRTAAAVALASLLCANATAKIVTIAIPGAQFVIPAGINDKGAVAGTFGDASNGYHGFLWQPDGTLATFDVPGAVIMYAIGISETGVIAGRYYLDHEEKTCAGFVRAADGTITTFTVPNGAYTAVYGENRAGWSVGSYARSWRGGVNAFLRSRSGATIEFSVPGWADDTGATTVNRSRMIAGSFGKPTQSYIRTPDGTITVFGDPNVYTYVSAMNDAGTITGFTAYLQTGSAYVRTIDGTFTTFNGSGTTPTGINNSGTIVGNYHDGHDKSDHGFIRIADGTFTVFDPPGAVSSGINAINNKGAITGSYTNQDGARLAFAGKP